tara:strand:+ start:737 stop:1534 length:798 start_codon:yes stop_codon:yes gene_type:complete
MSNILEKIVSEKIENIQNYKKKFSIKSLEDIISSYKNYLNFKKKLNEDKVSIIAEIKKSSPSAGLIVKEFDPKKIAREFFNGGASCLSILTEEKYFHGKLEYIHEIKKEIKLPVLCKDFFIDPFQVYLAKSYGADSILIILSAIDNILAKEIYALANELNMSTIVEVHDKKEAEYALNFEKAIVGINNRNLKTLETNISTTYNLYEILSGHPQPIISESGLKSKKEIEEIIEKTKINNFLVGESVLKSPNIALKLREFTQISLEK